MVGVERLGKLFFFFFSWFFFLAWTGEEIRVLDLGDLEWLVQTLFFFYLRCLFFVEVNCLEDKVVTEPNWLFRKEP